MELCFVFILCSDYTLFYYLELLWAGIFSKYVHSLTLQDKWFEWSYHRLTLVFSLSPLVQLYNNPQPAAPDRWAEGEGAGTSSQDQELSRVFPRPGLGRSQNQGLECPLHFGHFASDTSSVLKENCFTSPQRGSRYSEESRAFLVTVFKGQTLISCLCGFTVITVHGNY